MVYNYDCIFWWDGIFVLRLSPGSFLNIPAVDSLLVSLTKIDKACCMLNMPMHIYFPWNCFLLQRCVGWCELITLSGISKLSSIHFTWWQVIGAFCELRNYLVTPLSLVFYAILCCVRLHYRSTPFYWHHGPLLLKWINLKLSMDKLCIHS